MSRGSGTATRSLGGLGVGTAVMAACSYATLVVAARTLGPERYGSFAVAWALVFVLGPGVFLPVEQEGARGTAAARAAGLPAGAGTVLRWTASGLVPLLALLGLVVVLAGDRLGLPPATGLALGASLVGVAVAHGVRGLLAGAGRLAEYGRGLAVEGVLRLSGALALAASGTRSAALFVALAGLPSGAGALTGRRRGPGQDAPSPEPTSALVADRPPGPRGVVALVGGSLCAQVLINAGPVAGALVAGPDDGDAAGLLLAGLVLARVPLLGFSAVQALLLPRLSALALTTGPAAVRATLRRTAGWCLLAGAVAVLGTLAVGTPVHGLLFGEDLALDPVPLAVLVAAVMAFGTAGLLGCGLLVAHRAYALASSWSCGAAVFVAAVVLLPGTVGRVAVALLAGCLAAALLVAGQVLRPRAEEE